MTVTMEDLAATVTPDPGFQPPDHKASRNVEPEAERPQGTRQRPGIFGKRDASKTPTRKPRTIKADPPYEAGAYTETIQGAYEFVGQAIIPFDPHCGQVIKDAAVPASEAWDGALRESPALRRFVAKFSTTTAWGALAIAHAPIIYAVAVHHTPIVEAAQRRAMTFMAQRMQQPEDMDRGDRSGVYNR
jgi:hypothetical protein